MAIRTVVDPDGTVRQVNDAYAGQVGYGGWDTGQQQAMTDFNARRSDPNAMLTYYKNLMGVGPSSTYQYDPTQGPSRTDPNSTGYNQWFAGVQAGQNPFTQMASQNWVANPWGQQSTAVPPMMTAAATNQTPSKSSSVTGNRNQSAGLTGGTSGSIGNRQGLAEGDTGWTPPSEQYPRGRDPFSPGWGIGIGWGGGGSSAGTGGTPSGTTGTTDTRSRSNSTQSTGTAGGDGRIYNPLTDPRFYGGVAADVLSRGRGDTGGSSSGGSQTPNYNWTSNPIQTPASFNANLPANLGGGIGFQQYQNWLGMINPQLTRGADFANSNQAYLDQNLRNSNQIGNSWNWYQNAANQAEGNPAFNQYNQFSSSLDPFWQSQAGNLNYLSQYGLPGNQQLQQEQQGYGAQAGALLGQTGNPYAGQGQNYGLQQLLQQVMAQGLPGQSNIEGLTSEFANRATGTGLTPEYLNAMRQQVLQPTQESYQGAANRQGGGVAQVPTFDENGQMTSAGSGLFAELARRNERDFNNQMITQGFQNIPTYANIANQSYGNVASSALPYVNTASNLALGLGDQSLNRFNVGSQQGLNSLATTQNLAMQPSQQNFNNYSQLMNSYLQSLGQGQNFGLGQGQLNNALYLGQLGPYADLMQSNINNDYNAAMQRYLQEQLGNEAWGKIAGQVAGAVGNAFGGN